MSGRWNLLWLFLIALTPAAGVIIDQIAIRVDNSIIKDSDISRNIRVTDFLNDKPLAVNAAARKEAANRLIDQVFIREEIRVGDYPRAEWSEADQEIAKLKKARYKGAAAFTQALAKYGLVEPDLRFEYHWQLTVLRFIDARFRPAVLVTDADIDKYLAEHRAQFQKMDADDARDQVRDTITAQRVNDEFFAWLDDKRKLSTIQYFESGLK